MAKHSIAQGILVALSRLRLQIGRLWQGEHRPWDDSVTSGAHTADTSITRPRGRKSRYNDAPRARSPECELRDSLLATEVVEVGFEDQLASDIKDGEVERAVMLLRQLMRIRPDELRHRVSLLSLLQSRGKVAEFVEEARAAWQLDPPIDAKLWSQICEWGSALDPGNKLFTTPPRRPPADERGKTGQPEQHPDPGARSAQGDDQSNISRLGKERRSGSERRVSNSRWLGKERRSGRDRRMPNSVTS